MELINYLRSPQAIRDRCQQVFDLVMDDKSNYFTCDYTKIGSVADYVRKEIEANYPDLDIPFHSRWRHFQVGGVDRIANLQEKLASLSPIEQAIAQFDLAIISVLLDAGAGERWSYPEPKTNLKLQRSEGLAIASYHMFCGGMFSSDASQPLRVDAEKLINLTETELQYGFQLSDRNSLLGISGRVALLQKLGQVIQQKSDIFVANGTEISRPGHLLNYLLHQCSNQEMQASCILTSVLDGFSEIWPSRQKIAGVNLGDVWFHPQVRDDGLVPFHKLSQWLTYSLFEPLQKSGIEINNIDELTGLPEYRNGGLLIDLGLIQAKQANIFQQRHSVDSPLIVEWRSLTVILLDHLAQTLRTSLGLNSHSLPLAKILQGGTWSAGRKIAAQLRSGGTPPIAIISDGTVF